MELLESGNISIVKGNAGEIFSLVGIRLSEGVSGVDYVGEDIMELPAEELEKTAGVLQVIWPGYCNNRGKGFADR